MLRISIPPVTRAVVATILILSFFYNLTRWKDLVSPSVAQPSQLLPYLTLVPSVSIFYPWTFATATFVEQNILTLIVNTSIVYFAGRYLERAWGSQQFAQMLAIVTISSNLIAVLLYLLWAMITSNPARSQTSLCGGVATQALCVVAFKQLVPEHTVTIARGMIKMRVKHFPALFLLVNTISGIILGTDTATVLSWVGLVNSWTYLRFYKRQEEIAKATTSSSVTRGDASETFAFAMFFPDVIQPPITFICDRIYDVLVSIGVCTAFSADDINSSNEQTAARNSQGLPTIHNHGSKAGRGSSKREEAERRRALALRALDQRLNASNATVQPQTLTPAMLGASVAVGETSSPTNQFEGR